ncbi:hypothetical protein DFH11DRAFT_1502564 [Phellopilus nigrolimitatus]|nr:hypothetical protein DFH11DRAFT_1502564 [Phellopilus nigrolimitatus]
MITHDNFERACKSFIDKNAYSDDSIFGGWRWNEHPNYPGLGYLARETIARSTLTAPLNIDAEFGVVNEEGDYAVASSPRDSCDLLEVWQYIVYSATFQVPTFYFSVHTTSGSPLSLDDIMKSSFFRKDAFPDVKKTSFALQAPDHPFPLLSQGEHPVLGTPCWFFHPCETRQALLELVQADGLKEPATGRHLELWLLLVGNVVDLRG